MVRPSRKKEVVNTSVINVKINENNEIEYMEVNEVASEDELYADENTQDNEYDAFGEDDVDDDDVDDEDGDPDYEGEEELIPNEDGTMTIKMPEKKVKKKQVVEHVCAKCSKSYSSVKVNYLRLFEAATIMITNNLIVNFYVIFYLNDLIKIRHLSVI